MKDKTKITPFKNYNAKIYAYSLPAVLTHQGCIKVGETSRDVETRLK